MRRDRDDGCDRTRQSRRVAFATTDDDDASRRVARHSFIHSEESMNHVAAHVVARAIDDAFDDADDDASDDDSTDADDPSDWMSSSRSRSRVVLDDADGSSRVIIRDEIDDENDDARPSRAAMRATTRVVVFSTRRDVRGRVRRRGDG